MRILRYALIGLVVIILALGIVGFFLPSQAHVERSIEIDAPVTEVYAVVSDLSQFNRWSPWYKLDPDAKYTLSGAPGTVGNALSWESDKRDVGNGKQSIVALEPGKEVRMALDFGSEGPADAYYRLAPSNGGTRVVWAFDTDMGGNPYMHYFAVAMDAMLGPSYEQGLAQLKRYIEDGVGN